MDEGAAVFTVDGPADGVARLEKDIRGAAHDDLRPVVFLGHQGGQHGLRLHGVYGVFHQQQLVHSVVQQHLFGVQLQYAAQ